MSALPDRPGSLAAPASASARPADVPFRPVAVIPVYNHGQAIPGVVARVRASGLRCVLVDDGSDAACAAVLDQLARSPDVTLVRLPRNQGKGGAMMAGFRAAAAAGYSHALQIDADGQHDAGDIPTFLAAAARSPRAVVCGTPVYDDSIPAIRFYGRYASHLWVWISSLSFAIRDSMCGFRVYPLASVVALIDSARLGRRMDFDPEVLVRLHWRGVQMLNVPTRVTYPRDGVSHFRYGSDNLLIAAMYLRLFTGMLLRSPLLLWRKLAPR
jgi:glycosyltransferase involved in cell wall biosynthesis